MKNYCSTLLTLLTAFLLFASFGAGSQESRQVLKVQGEALFEVEPEIMVVQIPIQIKDENYENCTKQLVDTYNRLKDALVENQIEEDAIRSSNLNVRENFRWEQNEQKFAGYIGSISVTVEQDYNMKNLSTIINVLKDEAFRFGYNVGFKLSEKQKAEQLEKAINMAVEDAQNKAKIIAGAMNVELTEIEEINFDAYASRITPITRSDSKLSLMNSMQADSGISLDVNPQLVPIMKSIEIIWKIKQ